LSPYDKPLDDAIISSADEMEPVRSIIYNIQFLNYVN
jgi:hypothetical protein